MDGSLEEEKSNPKSSSACPFVVALPLLGVDELESVGDSSENDGPPKFFFTYSISYLQDSSAS